MLERKFIACTLTHPISVVFFGLGWMRITRVIQVRKLLFIRAILALEEETLSRKIFVVRAVVRFSNENDSSLSEEWSIVDDLLNVADMFNLNHEIRNMVIRGHIYPKALWKQIVLNQGWSLEDTFWCLEARLHRELDLLLRICPNPRYLTWWNLSNRFPNRIHASEIMAKMICRSAFETSPIRK